MPAAPLLTPTPSPWPKLAITTLCNTPRDLPGLLTQWYGLVTHPHCHLTDLHVLCGTLGTSGEFALTDSAAATLTCPQLLLVIFFALAHSALLPATDALARVRLTLWSKSFICGRSSSLTLPRLDSRVSLWCGSAPADLSMATISCSNSPLILQPTSHTFHASPCLLGFCGLLYCTPPHSRQFLTFCSHKLDGQALHIYGRSQKFSLTHPLLPIPTPSRLGQSHCQCSSVTATPGNSDVGHVPTSDPMELLAEEFLW